MHAKVTRDQFVITDETIIHKPTGAEFTPVVATPDSVIIWTGEIGCRLNEGEIYRYADMIAMMKSIKNERFWAA
jgi:hypothetical protein